MNRFPEGEYLVSDKRRLCVCTIPKVGSSTLAYWFWQIHRFVPPPPEIEGTHPGRGMSRGYAVQTWGWRNHPELDCKGYFKFVFLRDPWDRLASAYVNKLVNSWNYPGAQRVILGASREIGRGRRSRRNEMQRIEAGISFAQFVRHLAGCDLERADPHWRPQRLFLGPTRWDHLWPLGEMTARLTEIGQRYRDELDPEWLDVRSIHPTEHPIAYDRSLSRWPCVAEWRPRQLRALKRYPPHHAYYDAGLRKLVGVLYRDDVALYRRITRGGAR